MKTNYLLSTLLFVALVSPSMAQETNYQRPPAIIEEIALANLSPITQISDNNQWMLQLERSPYRSIAKLAQPELKIAGVRINPITFNTSRQAEYIGAKLMHMATQKEIQATGFPQNAVITEASFSPSSQKVALFVEEADGVYLYTFTPDNPQIQKVSQRKINATGDANIQWISDDEYLVLTVPQNIGAAPEKPNVPTGPVVQENTGKIMPARTYQDLLKNPYDEKLFDYYFTSQLVKIKNGQLSEIGKPAIQSVSLSPDNSLLLVSAIHRPYSYQVPMYYFPQAYKITDLNGKDICLLADNPEVNVPMGYDATSPYPRQFNWRADKPATIYWTEAQDKGDPKQNKVQFMDIIYQWSYPFTGVKQEVVKTEKRFANILWHDDSFALLQDYSRATNRARTWTIKPVTTEAPQILFDISTDDNYNNPGTPLKVKNAYNQYIVYTNKAHSELLMLSQGASQEGDMPYLGRYNLKDKKNTILWRCEAPWYETIVKVSDPEKLSVITSRQSNSEPANLFTRELKKKKSTQLTHFPNPYPAMEKVSKQKIQYKRSDGLDLTATVYLPAGYDKEKDGRLPVLMWAYPREFRSKADAAQVRGSKYAFTNINYGSPVFWAVRGYCVMENVEMPIVSTNEGVEPNDNFLEQLTMNAEAAVKIITDMGVGDPDRIAVGGHSYGAFMTANLLTHTKLFKAGIARSGAYNRTLTPFGFQAETRTYWEAPEVYNTMSPFMYANQLNGALLLIHGEMDNNTGTFPIQSERLFSALQGHGAITRYVVLPYESHGYAARENILHLLYETDQWLNTYVKGTK